MMKQTIVAKKHISPKLMRTPESRSDCIVPHDSAVHTSQSEECQITQLHGFACRLSYH